MFLRQVTSSSQLKSLNYSSKMIKKKWGIMFFLIFLMKIVAFIAPCICIYCLVKWCLGLCRRRQARPEWPAGQVARV